MNYYIMGDCYDYTGSVKIRFIYSKSWEIPAFKKNKIKLQLNRVEFDK